MLYDAVALFSGGLDSILAVKTLEAQGLSVKCLHYTSPFFGKPERLDHWRHVYGLDIAPVDVGEAFAKLLRARPVYGFGKTLNPCVDCKILMLRDAAQRMRQYAARCVISGEVIGQRPMSQRRDALNIIRRDSGLGDALLRPLCAAHLAPTAVEREGLVDRSRLHALFGRGRSGQMALAAHYGLTEIPTPGGGCRLTEKENTRRYWPVLCHMPEARAEDFALANIGRQLWAHTAGKAYWLCVGRNAADNAQLEHCAAHARTADIMFTLHDVPGPLGLARPMTDWTREALECAAAVVASYAPQAVRQCEAVPVRPVRVDVHYKATTTPLYVMPQRRTSLVFAESAWEEVQSALQMERASGANAVTALYIPS